MSAIVEVPRVMPVSATAAERLMFTWLSRPRLAHVTLISFGLDAALEWNTELTGNPTFVLESVERTALECPVTLVTSAEAARAEGRRGQRVREWLRKLDRAGVTVLTHDTLHAKVYLFEQADRRLWLVGSTNLSRGGFGQNEEVNLRGFHPDDYAQVEFLARQIVAQAYPYTGRL
jgi:hypothetical protein